MKPGPTERGAFFFSALLSAIAVIANVAGQFLTDTPRAGMTAFLCFLPMAFWIVDRSQQRTRQYVEALETRIRQLERGEGEA